MKLLYANKETKGFIQLTGEELDILIESLSNYAKEMSESDNPLDENVAKTAKAMVDSCKVQLNSFRIGKWVAFHQLDDYWNKFYKCSICQRVLQVPHGREAKDEAPYCHCGAYNGG